MDCIVDPTDSALSLSDFADIAQVAIALFNVGLAVYILIYQRRKDSDDQVTTALLHEQNIRLQWFKELVIQPKITTIENFYSELSKLREKIATNDLSIEQKENLNEFVKAESSKFRRSFIDVLLQIDPTFYQEALSNIDKLVDDITESIFNDNLKLAKEAVYDTHIGKKISYSRNSLIAQIYKYKGIASPNTSYVKSS